ncbi:uncharacterized protein LOC110990766 [Acanthaster planci]|uniref:Uncharacterized protein LOC110990766 n=1 Tax=Acanthaster planci TaxID=133434 RepID=A0A8B8A6E8_ACAPL|nr:uncharacterized protein LOC110990766 [Acanthaster planci]
MPPCKKSVCGPCQICGRTSLRWIHLIKTKNENLKSFMHTHLPELSDTDCICNACRHKYIKKLKTPTYTPEKTRTKTRPMCFLANFELCNSASVCDCSYTLEQLKACFPNLDLAELPNDVPLCRPHKSHVYNFGAATNCAACGIYLASKLRTYSCANINIENAYLMLQLDKNETTLTSDSTLCYMCYSVSKRVEIPDLSLDDLESSFLENVKDIGDMSHSRSALLKAAIEMCNRFHNNEAFLLVDIYEEVFIPYLNTLCCQSDNCFDSCKRTSRWMLSGLIEKFGNLLDCHKMPAPKFGILLMYKDLDMKKALHLACARLRFQKRKDPEHSHSDINDGSTSVFMRQSGVHLDCTNEGLLAKVNEKLKQQAKEITDYFTKNPTEVASFTFESVLDMIDPLVWNMISITTATVDELQYSNNVPFMWDKEKIMFPGYSKSHGKQRRNRRIILTMYMQFVLNESNNCPLHIVVANCVKRLSHSSKLLRLLNQSGFCVSEDTLDRFLENIKEIRQKAGVLSTLEEYSFTVVSIDNIDAQSTHAAISSEKTQRSWHGTSVMAQQPKPITEKLCLDNEILGDAKNLPDFHVIPIYGDGRCLFRCVAAFSNYDILHCDRNAFGIPSDTNVFLEEILADNLRHAVCDFLSLNIAYLETLPVGVKQFLLESSPNTFYASFVARIEDEHFPGTYGGCLEICALASICQIDIHIYQRSVEGIKLVAKYPIDQHSGHHICLLYRPDSASAAGHFDLLLSSTCRPNCHSLIDFDSHATIPMQLNYNAEQKIELMDMLLAYMPMAVEHNPGTSDIQDVHEHALVTSSGNNGTSFQEKTIEGVTKKPSVRRQVTKLDIPLHERTYFSTPLYKTFIPQQLSFENFSPTEGEREVEKKLSYDVFMYIVERHVTVSGKTQNVIPGLKCNMVLHAQSECEQSKFSYLYVLNEKADSALTIKSVVSLLYDLFHISKSVNHLVVLGDGATFRILLDVKKEYGEVLDWVVPYIGDWHILKNFQEVLMKVFWDAGLKDIARLTHKGGTLRNMKSCSNFKRTHRFILQVYEAFYIHQFKCFLDFRMGHEQYDRCVITNEKLQEMVIDIVQQLQVHGDSCDYSNMQEFVSGIHVKLHNILPSVLEEFNEYCNNMTEKFETFKFWNRFLKEDCFCYIQLWIAMRSGNWQMRLCALKRMAPLFFAFDRQNYSKLIPIHLSQMYGLPSYIAKHFENGGFVSSIRGANFSSVGFDEAHEMLINKDCKIALSRGLPTNMEKMAGTLEFQGQLINSFHNQLALSVLAHPFQRDMSPSVIASELKNVKVYFSKVSASSIFNADQSPTLHSVFDHTPANKVQQKALLGFRDIGTVALHNYVRSCILKDPSVNKPVIRRHQLRTFAKEKVTKRKINLIEKEKKMVTLCYKRTIAYSQEHNLPINQLLQFVETPRALCTPSGMPYKGAKYVIYDFFGKRYEATCCLITDSHVFNTGACLIAEGMNIIYTNPLSGFKFFWEYAMFIVSRWIKPYFRKQYKEVRILFDQVCSQGVSPKGFERERRDIQTYMYDDDDDVVVYDDIHDQTNLPPSWSKFLKVRQNKRLLCNYLSNKFIEIVSSSILTEDQIFVTSGGFEPNRPGSNEWTGKYVTKAGVQHHTIFHNHEETDTQIWLHVADTKCSVIHIYSVDRDIGMIGLPLVFDGKSIIIQYKASATNEKYLHLNNLQSALKNDPDLAGLVASGCDICKIIQVLYICTGCDFVSYFARLGKSTFFRVFFQFAAFISGNDPQTGGHLSNTNLNVNHKEGLLSFYRLVGCVYFQANRACLTQHANNPVELFDSIQETTSLDQHYKFLSIIRKASWKGEYEDTLLPSDTALSLHWLRSCWVSSVWGSALQPVFDYPDVKCYGWAQSENDARDICIVWDSSDNMERVRKNVYHLTRGCSCNKNKCLNRQCKCQKNNQRCGPGCTCRNCENVPVVVDKPEIFQDDIDSESNESHSSSEDTCSDTEDPPDHDIHAHENDNSSQNEQDDWL